MIEEQTLSHVAHDTFAFDGTTNGCWELTVVFAPQGRPKRNPPIVCYKLYAMWFIKGEQYHAAGHFKTDGSVKLKDMLDWLDATVKKCFRDIEKGLI